MGLSLTTRILNFIIAGIKNSKIFKPKKMIWEFSFELNNEEINPDLIMFFDSPEEFYSLIEIMGISTKWHSDEKNRKLKQFKQYKNLSFSLENLPSERIPAKNVELFINYIFFDTNRDIIDEFIDDVIQNDSEIYIYSIQTKEKTFEIIQSENSNNHKMIMELMQNIDRKLFWRKTYVPFMISDLTSIKGDAQNNVVISRDESRIVVSHVLSFILNRKITNKSSEFYISDLLIYIFEDNIAEIGDQERRGMIRKLRLVLKYLTDELFQNLKLDVLERINDNKYKIKLRNNKTLIDRFREIEKAVKNYLSQETLLKYFN
jgi:hypothetical protein